MSERTAVRMLIAITAVIGIVIAILRGVWTASPVLVLVVGGALLQVMRPVPKDRPGRIAWAVAHLVGLAMAVAATWLQSVPLLIVGLAVMVISVIGPNRK